jgi:hypothetical protein
MTEILKNAKLNELGLRILHNDFNAINKVCCEYMYEIFYNQINSINFLVEIFDTPLHQVDDFLEEINKDNNYDTELLKVLVKKRKTFKN